MSCNQDIVLTAVLECGTMDLSVLDGIEYDLGEIVDDLMSEGTKPTLNAIMGEVFRKAAEEMAEYVGARIAEVKEELEELEDLDDDDSGEAEKLEAELDALGSLNPEEDIGWFCNCMDTHIYFENKEDLYREYLGDAISTIEDKTGYSF